jgi:hypothetical protein
MVKRAPEATTRADQQAIEQADAQQTAEQPENTLEVQDGTICNRWRQKH